MPTAPVDRDGTELFYTDSGAPDSADYTTLVIFHGSAFNCNTFQKLLPLGAASNIRLVVVNRRDYAGSTKYTDGNLKELNAGEESFMKRLGLEVAHLLLWFADTQKVPKINADRKSGGFAVMGWSIGSATPLAVLAYPEVIGKETYQKLEPYFRKLIFFDPPFLTFGYDQPPEGYNPFTDPDFPDAQAVFENFLHWAGSYYSHPDLASRTLSGLSFAKRGESSTVETLTPEEMAEMCDFAATRRSEFPMYFPMQPVLKNLGQRSLFDEKLAGEILPNLEVVLLVCTQGPWYCAWGMIETERQHKEHLKQGHKVRPIRFIEIEGANHFVQWNDPQTFWAVTVDSINN